MKFLAYVINLLFILDSQVSAVGEGNILRFAEPFA